MTRKGYKRPPRDKKGSNIPSVCLQQYELEMGARMEFYSIAAQQIGGLIQRLGHRCWTDLRGQLIPDWDRLDAAQLCDRIAGIYAKGDDELIGMLNDRGSRQ